MNRSIEVRVVVRSVGRGADAGGGREEGREVQEAAANHSY